METTAAQFASCGGAGIVIDSTRREKRFGPGDQACLYPVLGCGTCEHCGGDREHMCAKRRLIDLLEPEVRLPDRNCFSIPANFSSENAATLGSAYLPAWHMLITLAKLTPGEFVLVHVNGEDTLAALQIAVQMPCHVLAASFADRALAAAKELGAERVFDARADFVKDLRAATDKHGVDVAIDCHSGETWMKTLACLARGGRLVTSGGSAGTQTYTDLQRIFWNHLKIYGSSLGSREDFNHVLRYIQSTGTRPHIKSVFPWRDLAAAQKLAGEKPLGSIIVRRGM